MSQADPSPAPLAPRELLAEAVGFAREAWRDCWLIMLLVTAVHTYVFARGHVARSDWAATPLDWLIPLGLILYIPLYGALYRVALGEPLNGGLGRGGLQWRALEWRLIAVGSVIALLVAMVAAPFLLISLIAAMLFGIHAQISLGFLGAWARWMPATVVIWLIFFWIMAPRTARLMLGWPFSSARSRVEPFAGWQPAARSGWTLALCLAAAFTPLFLSWFGLLGLTLLEPDTLSGEYWPAFESVLVGLLLGIVKVAIVAPLGAGILTAGWWLLEKRPIAAAPPLRARPLDGPRLRSNPFSATSGPNPAHAPWEFTPAERIGAAVESIVDAPIAAAPDASKTGLEDVVTARSEPEVGEGSPKPESEPAPVREPEVREAPVRLLETKASGRKSIRAALTSTKRASRGSPAAPTAFNAGAEASRPVSVWPHSTLPPWPAGSKDQASPDQAFEPLASEGEPDNPSGEASE